MMLKKPTLLTKLTTSVAVFIVLSICLMITSFALIYSMVTVQDNLFSTGFVKINLNNEEPVINKPDLNFEPGMRIREEFFIKNEGTVPVYYRLYFSTDAYTEQGVNNEDTVRLMKALMITINDIASGDPIYEGTAYDLTRDFVENITSDVKELASDEERKLEIIFRLPVEGVGEEYENCEFKFDLCADAVQVEANTDKKFE